MTSVKFTSYSMPAASLGEENPMPDFKNVEYIHAGYKCTDKITDEDKKYIGKGMIDTILPYMIQDNYNRDRKIREFPAAVLENDFIKAVFLPTLGGRLWSLLDKKLNRELLYVNSVFQPANLAVRNAWFSGGVEWNVGIKGHNPLTCSPMFTEFAETEKGEPVLRMYEYERIRKTVYSVEAYIPENEAVLYIRNTIENTSDNDGYTYWWSNIAVPETDGTRVIAPSDEAFLCHYNEGSYVLDKTPVPYSDNVDYSYPKNSVRSQDFFYKIPNNRAKWIAAVNCDGKGLIQFSQSRLIGRKMFLWGQGTGGRHWGEFLSVPGESYIEIQAGLAHTQLEHIPIKGGETISWIEGYCAASCSPEKTHGNWTEAQTEIEAAISKHVNLSDIDSCLEKIFPKSLKNRKTVQNGSGWGYVENTARKHFGKAEISRLYEFPKDSVTDREKQWLEILCGGAFENYSLSEPPKSYLTYPEWIPIIKNAAEKSQNWYGYLQLGVAYYANGCTEKSKAAFEKSLYLCVNPWALRNLAMIAKNDEKNLNHASELIIRAMDTGCINRGLTVDCANLLTSAKMYDKWLEIYKALPQFLQNDGRLLYFKAMALLRTGQAEKAAEIITPDFVMCDIKEGEFSISHLWFELYKELTGEDKHPLPYNLDFRMHE